MQSLYRMRLVILTITDLLLHQAEPFMDLKLRAVKIHRAGPKKEIIGVDRDKSNFTTN